MARRSRWRPWCWLDSRCRSPRAHAELVTACRQQGDTVVGNPPRDLTAPTARTSKPDGSSLGLNDRDRRTVSPAAGSCRTAAPRDVHPTPATPLAPGMYTVESTTRSRMTATSSGRRGVHGRDRRDAGADADRHGCRRAPRPADGDADGRHRPPLRRPHRRAEPIGDGTADGERRRRRLPDHRRRWRSSRSPAAAYLADADAPPDRPTRHADDHDAPADRRDPRRLGRCGADRAVRRRPGSRSSCRRPSRRTRSTRRTRAGCRWRSTWSGRRRRSPCRSSSCIVRDVRAAAARPDRRGGRLPPAWLRIALRAIGLIGWVWIVAQGIAGGVERRRRGDALPVGLRLGRAWRSCRRSSAPPGSSSTRSRRSMTWGRVLRRCTSRAGRSADYPERPRALAGDGGLRRLRLARAGGHRRPVDAVRRARRLHALTLAMMAQFGRDEWRSQRRDVHGLVPAARSARLFAPGRRGRARRAAGRSASGLLEPGWSRRGRDARRARRRRRSCSTGCRRRRLLRPVRAPGIAIKTVLLFALPRHRRRCAPSPWRGPSASRRDRRGPAADRRSAISSPTT